MSGSEAAKPFWSTPGPWAWAAIALGAAIRAYFVLFTEGTTDARIWETAAMRMHADGLIAYYREILMNHPPTISQAMVWLWQLSEATGIPFRVLLRAPFALLDGGTALLLVRVLRDDPHRFGIAACYWLHPLALIFSSYHGNTDSAIAFFLVLCVHLLSSGKLEWAAIAFGLSLWVKLPGALAAPALLLFLPSWHARARFAAIAGAVGIAAFLPALLVDPEPFIRNVFGYRGQGIQTSAGMPVWGPRVFYPYIASIPGVLGQRLEAIFLFLFQHNSVLTLLAVLAFCALRRAERSTRELCVTIAGAYSILYGFSAFWSFQYFAWSIPFWLCLRTPFPQLATLLAGGYIYSLYALLCGSPWLLGEWDFLGHPCWPATIELLRDLAVIFFFASAWTFLMRAAQDALAHHRDQSA